MRASKSKSPEPLPEKFGNRITIHGERPSWLQGEYYTEHYVGIRGHRNVDGSVVLLIYPANPPKEEDNAGN